MPAVQINPPAALLAERRRLGLDLFDEMWEGELHMVPMPSYDHQTIEAELLVALMPLAKAAGLRLLVETGLYDPDVPGHTSFRVPDLLIFRPELAAHRGVEGAASLAVEIRSPQDESFEKLPYYERLGVGEVLILDADERYVRRWVNGPDGLVESTADADGGQELACVPVRLRFDRAAFVAERRHDDGTLETIVRLG